MKNIFRLALFLSTAVVLAQDGKPSPFSNKKQPKREATDDRVTHYAFVTTGPAFRGPLGQMYWKCNEKIQAMLDEYGYPEQAVYRLCEFGPSKGPGVDGTSTYESYKRIFEHLAKILQKDDHLFIFLVGHGSPAGNDFVHPLVKGQLTATEFKRWLDAIPTSNITVVMNPCFSGGFLPKLSAPGRVICTSTNDRETNSVGWAESMADALRPGSQADVNKDGKVSIKEAYNVGLENTLRHYGQNLREHPLLDDNGDSVGHMGKEPVVDGDGKLAAERFLGHQGKKLSFSAEAIEKLKKLNAELKLE
jgi:hypothetical protein